MAGYVPERIWAGLLRQGTSMEQVEGLLEELPAQTKIHRNLWSYLPIILEIERDVVLLERNQGVTERQISPWPIPWSRLLYQAGPEPVKMKVPAELEGRCWGSSDSRILRQR